MFVKLGSLVIHILIQKVPCCHLQYAMLCVSVTIPSHETEMRPVHIVLKHL